MYAPATTDVAGDGNCYWHALALLTKQDARSIKQASVNNFEYIKDAWFACQPSVSESLWQSLIARQHIWKEYANEVSVAASSVTLDRCVVVISDKYLSLFAPAPPSVEQVKRALQVQLHAQHYQAVPGYIPEEVAHALIDVGRHSHPHLC